MSNIKEQLRRAIEIDSVHMADIQDALAEIERLEADRGNWVESSQANTSALTKALKQAQDFRAQAETMRAALRRAREDMAGWAAYANQYFREKHRLSDDLAAIDAALSTPPAETETDEARELRRSGIVQRLTAVDRMLAEDVVRAIAESDRAAKGAGHE